MVWTKPVLQAMIKSAVLALDCVGESEDLPATRDRTFSLVSDFLIV